MHTSISITKINFYVLYYVLSIIINKYYRANLAKFRTLQKQSKHCANLDLIYHFFKHVFKLRLVHENQISTQTNFSQNCDLSNCTTMLNCRPKFIMYVSCIKKFSIFGIVYVSIYMIHDT